MWDRLADGECFGILHGTKQEGQNRVCPQAARAPCRADLGNAGAYSVSVQLADVKQAMEPATTLAGDPDGIVERRWPLPDG
jgi:hypothetical protein